MKKCIILIVVLGLLWSVTTYFQYSWFLSKTRELSDAIIEIEDGDTFSNLWRKLGIESKFFYKLYIKNNTPNYELQKGVYSITPWSIDDILQNQLQIPLNKDEQITILEWWNIYDIDIDLTNKWLIPAWDFVSYATKGNFQQYHFLSELDSLEWYLYPDTYNINPANFTSEKLASKMLENFNTKVYQPLFSHADNTTIFELITLASIVQKEASFWDDKTEIATIAGILKKRLDEWWQIGADATVCYAHKVATQDCTPEKVIEYLYDTNNYNTRAIAGLPAWPIANPEQTVVEATLKSIDSEYYYYLHDNSWKIHYGRTNADHINNKNKYLR